MNVWQSLSVARAVFSFLGWFLCVIFIRADKTCEALEKRDFSLIDEIVS